jgi:hypothetical protein
VSAVRWLGSESQYMLATSSYDGSVRVLDVNSGIFDQVENVISMYCFAHHLSYTLLTTLNFNMCEWIADCMSI